MRNLLGLTMVVALIAWAALAGAEDKPKYTIKDVMGKCMKGGLCGKVAGGTASAEEKKQLLEMFTAMAACKCPKGEEASWKEKTTALVAAAQAAVDGNAEAGAKLKAAANCMACHKSHK